MQARNTPFHAHVYYTAQTRDAAAGLRDRLLSAMEIDRSAGVLFVGQMRDYKVGPHPDPQYEVHFLQSHLSKIAPLLQSSGLSVLVHPLTLNDLADHTTLAQWIGEPIPLDLRTLDPPGINHGIARFGRSDV